MNEECKYKLKLDMVLSWSSQGNSKLLNLVGLDLMGLKLFSYRVRYGYETERYIQASAALFSSPITCCIYPSRIPVLP